MSEELCNQHHGYDTGLFDSIIRSLVGGSNGLHAEAEPLDNFLTVAMIWFFFGVVLVLFIGVVLLVVLEKVSGGNADPEADYFYDEEKRMPPEDADEY